MVGIPKESGKRNVCNAELVESVEMALENPFSHGRGCPAWLCVVTDSSGPARFVLEWYRLVRGANSRIWRWWWTTTQVQRRLYEGRAAKREPSQKISSTIVLWIWECRGPILREAIGDGGACASCVSSNWNLSLWLFCFKDWTCAKFTFVRERSGGGGLGWGLRQEIR